MLDVAIINLNLSNLHSVSAACKKVGLKSKVTSDKKVILNAKSIILPGIGSFSEAMLRIKKLNLESVIKKSINEDKPFLGICLGMQLLFSKSEEFGNSKGLSIFKGSVKKFKLDKIKDSKFPVPHVGWNEAKPEKSDPMVKGLLEDSKFYFVHSYFVKTNKNDNSLMKTKYGVTFDSAISQGNIYGFQFHPEKSHKYGMKILKNFSEINTYE